MKLMFSKQLRIGALISLLAVLFVCAGDLSAQTRKHANLKKDVAKKTEKHARDARKDRARAKTTAKSTKKDTQKAKLTAKEKAKETAKAKAADERAKKDPKKAAESKRVATERRRAEEARRQAIIAEQRRREQAAREARARKLAFERGLHTETIANISNDKTDGEDLQIRQAAVNALASHAGSVVVMEAQTGKVLTIVNQDWAIRTSIRPCSTIKLVTGVAGLNEDVIDNDGAIRNTPTRRNLDDAIAFSDNGYFQRVGSNLGSSKLIEYAKDLGLGEPTGINADGESAGKLPYGNNNARIYSHGDDTEVTPLQLAVMVSAISNGGMRVIPRTPRNSVEKASFQAFYRQRLDLPQHKIRRVIPGMIGTAEYGTARRGVDASLGVAGKTGSCISKGSWVGLFVSVAPIENPKYSVVVITRGQGERGKYAAAVAGKIYQALSPQLVRTDRNLAQTEFQLKPRRAVDPKTAAKLADEEDEDETADGVAVDDASRQVIVVQSAPKQLVAEKPAQKKLVKKTADSEPLFPPVVITYDRDGKNKKRPNTTKP